MSYADVTLSAIRERLHRSALRVPLLGLVEYDPEPGRAFPPRAADDVAETETAAWAELSGQRVFNEGQVEHPEPVSAFGACTGVGLRIRSTPSGEVLTASARHITQVVIPGRVGGRRLDADDGRATTA